jgi:hypothetical protein
MSGRFPTVLENTYERGNVRIKEKFRSVHITKAAVEKQ